jgi:hypothetical protein
MVSSPSGSTTDSVLFVMEIYYVLFSLHSSSSSSSLISIAKQNYVPTVIITVKKNGLFE